MSLEAFLQHRKTGDESFRTANQPVGFGLVEFWQWSASDLLSNVTRGRLAEFLVAKALGLAEGTRTEWDAYDLRMPSGLTIEVKSCAYLQSWRQLKLSPINFSVPLTRAWVEESRRYQSEAKRQADVYVFALLAHREKATVDPLDLTQWHFYVVRAARLNERKQASVTLKALQELCPTALTWEQLADAVRGMEAEREPAE